MSHSLSEKTQAAAGGTPAASARELYKVYGTGDTEVRALDGISVEFSSGQFTAIMGPSGSGKSTLMHCLAGLDRPSEGSVRIGETELTGMKDKKLTELRRDEIGFVFQSFNLVPTLTARENITLPAGIAGRKVDQQWFDQVIDRLGLAGRLDHRPAEMSGGQQQRVACARALVGRPRILFGDEPTGNLDSNSSAEVLSILRSAVDDYQQTVVIVTHDPRAASYADRVLFLADGKLRHELASPTSDAILDAMRALEEI
jgi:putative ABC transport system ATP-binding protein